MKNISKTIVNWPATITKIIWQAFCLCLTIGNFYFGFVEANDGNTLAGAFMMLLGTWLASVTFEAGNPIVRDETEVDDTNSMTIINEDEKQINE